MTEGEHPISFKLKRRKNGMMSSRVGVGEEDHKFSILGVGGGVFGVGQKEREVALLHSLIYDMMHKSSVEGGRNWKRFAL